MHTIAKISSLLAIFVCLAATGCRMVVSPEAAKIHAEKSSTLIAWLNEEQLPEDENLTNQDECFFPDICDELVVRHQVKFLLDELNASNTPDAKEWLVPSVLYRIDDRRIYNAFVQRLSEKEDRESYYVALYLAQRGNVTALATLNRHFYKYEIASFEWAEACDTFGKFRYMPAASNLVDCLDAASLNASAAACNALQEIFPGSPKRFLEPTQAEEYYKKRLNDSITNPFSSTIQWYEFGRSASDVYPIKDTITIGRTILTVETQTNTDSDFPGDDLILTVRVPGKEAGQYYFTSAYGYGSVFIYRNFLLLKYGIGRGISARVDRIKVLRLNDDLDEVADVQSSYYVVTDPHNAGPDLFEYRLKIRSEGDLTTLSLSLPKPRYGLPSEMLVKWAND